MKKQKVTSEGVTKASIKTQVHALQKDIIDFLTRHTVEDALHADFRSVNERRP